MLKVGSHLHRHWLTTFSSHEALDTSQNTSWHHVGEHLLNAIVNESELDVGDVLWTGVPDGCCIGWICLCTSLDVLVLGDQYATLEEG